MDSEWDETIAILSLKMAYLEGPERTLRIFQVGYPMDWNDDDDYCDFYGNLSVFGCSSTAAQYTAGSRTRGWALLGARLVAIVARRRKQSEGLKDAIKGA